MQKLISIGRRMRVDVRFWPAVLALVLFLPQATQLMAGLGLTADSRPIIYALDNDAANAIDVAQRSYWYNDNRFSAYGNLYFRIAGSIGRAITPLDQPGSLSPEDAGSRAIHLGLLATSLLAFEGLAILLASIVMREWWSRLLLATGFIAVLIRADTWQKLLFQAHPDHLLTLLTALAVHATILWWRKPDDPPKLRWAAWAWGIALATKSSTLLFLPFVFGSVIAFAAKDRVKSGFRFSMHLAGAFFLIGFPQNFLLHRVFKFLQYQSGYSRAPTAESVREWISIYAEQAYRPLGLSLAVLFILGVFGRVTDKRTNGRMMVAGATLALGPLALLFAQNILAPHEHYVMPILASHLVLLLSFGTNKVITWSAWSSILVVGGEAVALVSGGLIPFSLGRTVHRTLECRAEARATFDIVEGYRVRGQDMYVDPYIPVRTQSAHLESSWKTNKALISAHPRAALALNRRYYHRYLTDTLSDYIGVYNQDWKSSQEFYRLFYEGQAFDDPAIGAWKRTYADACGNEIWTPWIAPRQKITVSPPPRSNAPPN